MKKMTTIKLEQKTKMKLDKYRKADETYEHAVSRIIKKLEQDEELAQAYEENAEEDLRVAKEWESTLGDGW